MDGLAVVLDFSGASAWDVFPSQAMETTVLPALQQHNVSIVRVYEALASRADLHAGVTLTDCTHFGSDAVFYMNAQVLKGMVAMLSPP